MKRITVKQPDEAGSRAADEWVSGTVTHVSANEDTQKHSKEKMARLTIDLPADLHGLFKAACAHQRTKMRDEIVRFIEEWTQKHRNP